MKVYAIASNNYYNNYKKNNIGFKGIESRINQQTPTNAYFVQIKDINDKYDTKSEYLAELSELVGLSDVIRHQQQTRLRIERDAKINALIDEPDCSDEFLERLTY